MWHLLRFILSLYSLYVLYKQKHPSWTCGPARMQSRVWSEEVRHLGGRKNAPPKMLVSKSSMLF